MEREIDKPDRDEISVIIYLGNCKIRGRVFVPPGGRVSDFVNAPVRQFIPVTDAEIESISGPKWSYRVRFLNLNKNEIVTIFPEAAFIEAKKSDSAL
jgi:predicted YcjX-like family ATPase